MEMTQKELAKVAGYTSRRLLDINKTLPDDLKLFIKGEGGKYDLAIFVQNWVKYKISLEKPDGDSALNTVRAAHERIKMAKSELLLRKMSGALIETEAVRWLWADIVVDVQKKLLSIPPALAPRLLMIDNPERIEDSIRREIIDALTMIANTPLPPIDESFIEHGEAEDGEQEV